MNIDTGEIRHLKPGEHPLSNEIPLLLADYEILKTMEPQERVEAHRKGTIQEDWDESFCQNREQRRKNGKHKRPKWHVGPRRIK